MVQNILKINFRDKEYSYYTIARDIYFVDENLKVINIIGFGAYQTVRDALEYNYRIMNLKPTYKDLIYENYIHKNYWEKDIEEMSLKNIIGFPPQRRRNMKHCFYNIQDFYKYHYK